MRVIAHRGNSRALPENTMAAFRSARMLGAHMIELDVRLSREGTPVVIHDPTLDRTTTRQGPVRLWSAPELAVWGVPALEDVLALGCPLNVEVKEPAAMPAVVELVHGREDVLVSSFDLEALDFLRQLAPDVPVAYLCGVEDAPEVLERAAGAWGLHPPRTAVTPELIAAAHAAGLRLLPFVVNDAADARQLFEAGVDAIFTDDPASMLAIL